ncbi:MAG TPA: hypothetical protein VGG45_01415 [Terracidiphilus sp.]|jgi:hypothetical protein
MAFNLTVFAIRAFELLFFIGLVGCFVVVILSWISVGKDSFSRSEK